MIAANVVLTLVVGAALGALVWQHPPVMWGWMQGIGLGLLATGFILWSAARFQLGRSLTVSARRES